MKKIEAARNIIGVMFALVFVSGCYTNTFVVKEPVVSSLKYNSKDIKPVTLTIVDKRTGDDTYFFTLQFGFARKVYNEVPFTLVNMEDPLRFFAKHLEQEFISRGIPVKCVIDKTPTDELTLIIHKYQIKNSRVSGFSTWESFHLFEGTIIANGREKTFKAYFYNGLLPSWTISEIEEPCFSIPESILIKDVASKINRAVFMSSASDEKVDMLVNEIKVGMDKKNEDIFWRVLDLGASNNSRAMTPLKTYAQSGRDEFFKSCALSAIGTLGAEGQLDFLKDRYRTGGFNDKYMAAKAIGDIGTPEALQVLREMKRDSSYEKEYGLKHCVNFYAP